MEAQSGQTLRTNIKHISKYVSDRICAMGFDMYVTFSRTSKSRYLEFHTGKWRNIIIRISDHPSFRYWKYDYDVYTVTPRKGAINYIDLLRILEKSIGESKGLIKVNKKGEFVI